MGTHHTPARRQGGRALQVTKDFRDRRYPSRKGTARVLHGLPRPAPPPSDLCSRPTPARLGVGTFPPPSVSAPGKGLRPACPAARRLGAGERAHRGGGALRAQRWGAAPRALPASPARKSRRRPRLSRFSRDREGRQGRLQLQIYVIFIVYSYFTM